uniref:Integrin subunit alpha 3 n=1 Tax=Chelonoidis abingdonii TaxID=106734 RepID=A0A8C0IM82_CHEAB
GGPGPPSQSRAALVRLCLLWGALCSPGGAGFNLDTKFLILKRGGTEGSFFGFSVALHRQTDGQDRYLLLTGAPQDVATGTENATRTGAVYSCPLSVSMNDCERVDIEEKSEPRKNIIEDMWLGVTIASQRQPSGRVLVSVTCWDALRGLVGGAFKSLSITHGT